MARIVSVTGAALAIAVLALPSPARSQDAGQHDADQAGHSHAGTIVSCTDLAAPPWLGLPDTDRARIAELRSALAGLASPEAARAAGYMPALGDIPGMGEHYVSLARMADGVHVDAPDHLLFATINGEQQLVGTAYAFTDVPDTDEPIPFESDLARWHDHPQFAAEGQTLHMLHVWFIPSSNGPFAGLNFWLPYRSAGITPPSACWMADEEDAQRIQRVSFALAPREWGDGGAAVVSSDLTEEQREILASMDDAANAENREAWMNAADRFLASLSESELAAVEGTLRALTMEQMSSAERDEAHH